MCLPRNHDPLIEKYTQEDEFYLGTIFFFLLKLVRWVDLNRENFKSHKTKITISIDIEKLAYIEQHTG